MDNSSEPAMLHKMSELCGKIPKVGMLDSDKVSKWINVTFRDHSDSLEHTKVQVSVKNLC